MNIKLKNGGNVFDINTNDLTGITIFKGDAPCSKVLFFFPTTKDLSTFNIPHANGIEFSEFLEEVFLASSNWLKEISPSKTIRWINLDYIKMIEEKPDEVCYYFMDSIDGKITRNLNDPTNVENLEKIRDYKSKNLTVYQW